MRILQEEYAKDKHYALLKDDLHQTARALQEKMTGTDLER